MVGLLGVYPLLVDTIFITVESLGPLLFQLDELQASPQFDLEITKFFIFFELVEDGEDWSVVVFDHFADDDPVVVGNFYICQLVRRHLSRMVKS